MVHGNKCMSIGGFCNGCRKCLQSTHLMFSEAMLPEDLLVLRDKEVGSLSLVWAIKPRNSEDTERFIALLSLV